jgi:hypothetical protein
MCRERPNDIGSEGRNRRERPFAKWRNAKTNPITFGRRDNPELPRAPEKEFCMFPSSSDRSRSMLQDETE